MTVEKDEGEYIKQCECGICEEKFKNGSIVKIARSLANHWNEEHYDELKHSETAFHEEEYDGFNVKDNIYQVRKKKYYITVYDVIDTSEEGLIEYAYAKNIETVDKCKDCKSLISEVYTFEEIGNENEYTEYICGKCKKKREIERAKDNNKSLFNYV